MTPSSPSTCRAARGPSSPWSSSSISRSPGPRPARSAARAVLAALAAAALLSCAGAPAGVAGSRPVAAPAVPLRAPGASLDGELRALWVATVYNIDWPSRPGLGEAELAAEAEAILDAAVSRNFNAVFLQVRGAADSLYPSTREPWSASISGRAGGAPPGGFDPLGFWLDGARARGLLLFAWVNPFRAGLPSRPAPDPGFPPGSLLELPGGLRWLDPGDPAAREYVVEACAGIVERYAVDGLVLDDYLYPYAASLGSGGTFPDAASRADGGRPGAGSEAAARRRANGEAFMRRLAARIRGARPGILLAVSPFGVWRNGVPEGVRGTSGADETGIDALAWAREGWVDIVSPQLYWPVTEVERSFPRLLAWWRDALAEVAPGVSLVPSLSPGTQRLAPVLRAHEAASEVMVARAVLGGAGGIALYSARLLVEDRDGIAGALSAGPFRAPATLVLSRPAARPGARPKGGAGGRLIP